MYRYIGAFVLVASMFIAACGGGDSDSKGEDAVASLERFVDATNKGQHGRRWDMLVPAHQAIVTRERYAECEGARTRPDLFMKVLEVFDEPTTIEGQRYDSKAITVEYTVKSLLGEQKEKTTAHAISVDGSWRFPLVSTTADTYRAGRCPS